MALRKETMATKKGRTGKPKRLYLNEKVTRAADKLAFENNMSLSQMVENLLVERLKKGKK